MQLSVFHPGGKITAALWTRRLSDYRHVSKISSDVLKPALLRWRALPSPARAALPLPPPVTYCELSSPAPPGSLHSLGRGLHRQS